MLAGWLGVERSFSSLCKLLSGVIGLVYVRIRQALHLIPTSAPAYERARVTTQDGLAQFDNRT